MLRRMWLLNSSCVIGLRSWVSAICLSQVYEQADYAGDEGHKDGASDSDEDVHHLIDLVIEPVYAGLQLAVQAVEPGQNVAIEFILRHRIAPRSFVLSFARLRRCVKSILNAGAQGRKDILNKIRLRRCGCQSELGFMLSGWIGLGLALGLVFGLVFVVGRGAALQGVELGAQALVFGFGLVGAVFGLVPRKGFLRGARFGLLAGLGFLGGA